MKRKLLFARVLWCIVSVAASVLWGMLIFGFSAQEGEESSGISEKISYAIVDEYNVVSKLEMSESELRILATKIEHPIRKCAHMAEYAFFSLLLFNMLCSFGMVGKKRYLLALFMVLIYAITDETHQLYVPGRSGQVTDVLIDVAGAAIMMLILSCILAKNAKRRDLRQN